MAKTKLTVLASQLDPEFVPSELKQRVWEWFERNQETTVLRVSILWIFSRWIRVRDLEPLFERVLGPRDEW